VQGAVLNRTSRLAPYKKVYSQIPAATRCRHPDMERTHTKIIMGGSGENGNCSDVFLIFSL
jgi:hypothetical protein